VHLPDEDARPSAIVGDPAGADDLFPPRHDAAARKLSCAASRVAIAARLAPESEACCGPVEGDIDTGLTLSHLMKKLHCTASPEGRRMRVMQVGANTGDNDNDHLVKFLKLGVADAVLLEPVPWIFRRLEQTYRAHSGEVVLVNAAMSETDGTVSFQAPDERARGWDIQRGGINLPRSSVRALKKNKALGLFKTITVDSVTFTTLVRKMGWSGKSKRPLDVFVVDAEGYDAIIMDMLLDSVASTFGEDARIPILQFEWKHLAKDARSRVRERLARLGYCVHQVHYDDVAVLPFISKGALQCEESFVLES
jgi:FkbM family methyltransferase